MFRGQRVLGIIPARGGSKRLPRKNIRVLNKKPMIAWTIDVANRTQILDRVVISTEDQEIASVAELWGGEGTVVSRPRSLSADNSSTAEVIVELLTSLGLGGETFGYVTLLQPTSPLRTVKHLNEAFDTITQRNAVGAISVCKTEHPVEWMGKLDSSKLLDSFFQSTQLDKQSQKFGPSYQINGAIYIVPVDQFLKQRTLFLSNGMVAYLMDRKDSVDIDNEYDLYLAESLISAREEQQSLI